ncbi:phosphoenolpyruvate--protein phosphotransferase [Roseospirillum parvum]|uniref:Phosphoenolpyruvate-protein phosphotransferase n=1 Tax=Roseospirillum parvum TaxID=83401 RepID=A0A1G7ZZS9_9PROT|nr:phosphoenolpyruvate--protein phosphotransferase [Roseospirillum parvum]SDH14141.1 phosphotransferase system, enzyme I, PtsI [Roseospirillum parvum]
MKTERPSGPATGGARQQVLEGLAVSPGVAVGTLYVHDPGTVRPPVRAIVPGRVASERRRLAQAVAKAERQMDKIQARTERLPATVREEMGYLLEAYQQMLRGSRLIRGVERRIESDLINAEAAVEREIADLCQAFASIDDSYLAGRIKDIQEVGQRLIRNLTKTPFRAFSDLPARALIVARELTPADTALLDPQRVAGLATMVGGTESHTAIMARSLGLPAVVGVADLLTLAPAGTQAVIDGAEGKVIVCPDSDCLADYRRQRAEYLRARRGLNRLRHLPACTRDGVELSLMANIELPGEVDSARQAGAEGIGLLRSEFLFMNRDALPGEAEQAELLRGIVVGMQGRPVTVRTLDAGGDKLGGALGPRLTAEPAANPALGLRAIRLSLRHPEVLEDQMAAILSAATLGPVRILLPMVTEPGEIVAARRVLAAAARRLEKRGEAVPDPLPPVGCMIEIPGAALAADALAEQADFFAIGTNDLTQYTLAIDRADETVADLYNPLHPAVLRLIQFTTRAALRARIPVSVCGEMAGDPRLVPLLVGLGLRELSMSSTTLPRVKQRIRRLTASDALALAAQVMSQSDSGRIADLLDELGDGGRPAPLTGIS